MKKIILFISIIILLSSCWHKIGTLTVCSTRNFESKAEYVLIKKDVIGKAKVKGSDVIESAIDDAVNSEKDGEFLKNVRIYLKNNGRKIKVTGDVWGIKGEIKK